VRALELQFSTAPSGEDALRLAQAAGRLGDREAIGRWLGAARAFWRAPP